MESMEIEALDWRSEAAIKSSDLVIRVTGSESDGTATYHVHELFIAYGDRKCAYFENLFQCMERSQDPSSSVRVLPITLKERAAHLFPQFLDFVYLSPSFRITADNAVALRYLAESFKNAKLLEETWKFIRKDMQISNFEFYLLDAICFGDKQTATWVAYGCAEHVTLITPCSPILQLMLPDDFKRMISLVQLCKIGHSLHCSELVVAYFTYHAKVLDERWFREVTSSENLPVISTNAALNLMEAEFQIRRGIFPKGDGSAHLSGLQRRCIMALAAHK
jgi:hypothetical protein